MWTCVFPNMARLKVKSVFFVLLSFLGVPFAQELDRFSLGLYKTLIGPGKENLVISPVSINTALGLLYIGAAGETAADMAKVMHLNSDQDIAASKFKTLLDRHAGGGSVQIANKLYVSKEFEVKPSFNQLASDNFHSSVETIDTTDGGGAALTINNWIESKTNSKITNVVFSSDVKDAATVLVNAVYFKADWQSQFDPSATREQNFWISETTSKKVDMMYQTSHFKFGDFDGFKAITLPYTNVDFSLIVILPHEREGLAAVETNIEQMNVKLLMDSLNVQYVRLALPKFKTKFKTTLDNILPQMGMASMFSRSADFSNLSQNQMRISNVIHEAVLEVDEDGTEAAAVTIMIGSRFGFDSFVQPQMFIADHPFLYLLVDSEGNIFFMGRYVK